MECPGIAILRRAAFREQDGAEDAPDCPLKPQPEVYEAVWEFGKLSRGTKKRLARRSEANPLAAVGTDGKSAFPDLYQARCRRRPIRGPIHPGSSMRRGGR